MKRLLLTIGLLLLATATSMAGYGPPLNLAPARTAADPCVLLDDGVYYLYVTSSYVDFECWSSPDLVTWTYQGVVWEQKPATAWNSVDVWAPEVKTDGERYYLYYAADMRLGLAVADSPLGPFVDLTDHPWLGGGYNHVEGYAIDAHVFQDDDQRLYLYYAGYAPFSGVHAVELFDWTTPADRHPDILLETGILNWELFVVEAPWMVKHDGTYYLMYSGDGANLPGYAIGYATGAEPLGGFIKYAGNPILHRDPAAGIFGPGHHATVTGPDGRLKIVYHTKQEDAVGFDREIRVNDLCFTAGGRLYVGLNGCTEQDPPAGSDDDSGADAGQAPGGPDRNPTPTADGVADGWNESGCGW